MRYPLLSGVLMLLALAGLATTAVAETPFDRPALQPCGESQGRTDVWAVNWMPAAAAAAPAPMAFSLGAVLDSDQPSADDQTAGRRRPGLAHCRLPRSRRSLALPPGPGAAAPKRDTV